MKTRGYYALSTTDAHMLGWMVYARASTPEGAEELALNDPDLQARDIYGETLRRNLRILPWGRAIKLAGKEVILEFDWGFGS